LKGEFIASNGGNFWVGDNAWYPGFNGKIDNIQIHERSLSLVDINTLSNGGAV